MKNIDKVILCILIFTVTVIQAIYAGNDKNKKVTISGFVKDAATGEALIGASVFPLEYPALGITTNSYGYFSLSLEAGNSPQMIFKHYRELVQPKEAKTWFSIKPETLKAET